MKIEVDEVTLPAYWASALVNGDYSGLEDAEAARCQAAEEQLARDGWAVVSTAEDSERFTCSYHLYDAGAGVSCGEVLDYIVHRLKGPSRKRDAEMIHKADQEFKNRKGEGMNAT